MSPKQLQGVSHLLEDSMIDAIAIAARIPRSNQASFLPLKNVVFGGLNVFG